MYGLKQHLQLEAKRLLKIQEIVSKQLNNAPEGGLRVTTTNNIPQYYHCHIDGVGRNGRFISKSNIELARQLAQKDYDIKILELINKRIKQIERVLSDYEDDEIEKLYYKENWKRRALITPVEMTWEDKIREWEDEEYEKKGFEPGTPIIMSKRGERVRSKSERTIANYLFDSGIPYKYEKPLFLNGYGVVYPDFSFIVKSGKKIYWEHEGRMDDPEYARKAINKIKCYEDNGILVGDQLILTFETSKAVLSTKEIERNVKHFWIE